MNEHSLTQKEKLRKTLFYEYVDSFQLSDDIKYVVSLNSILFIFSESKNVRLYLEIDSTMTRITPKVLMTNVGNTMDKNIFHDIIEHFLDIEEVKTSRLKRKVELEQISYNSHIL